MGNVKSALEGEISLLSKKIRSMLATQLEKKDQLYGMAWLIVWEAQIASYERVLKSLEVDSASS